MNTSRLRTLLPVLLVTAFAAVRAQPPTPATRGELLYTTQCATCHSAQMHWRDRRQATDWASLQAQVRRWQAMQGLNWSEEDITEVARYLNDTIYHHPQTSGRVGFAR